MGPPQPGLKASFREWEEIVSKILIHSYIADFLYCRQNKDQFVDPLSPV